MAFRPSEGDAPPVTSQGLNLKFCFSQGNHCTKQKFGAIGTHDPYGSGWDISAYSHFHNTIDPTDSVAMVISYHWDRVLLPG